MENSCFLCALVVTGICDWALRPISRYYGEKHLLPLTYLFFLLRWLSLAAALATMSWFFRCATTSLYVNRTCVKAASLFVDCRLQWPRTFTSCIWISFSRLLSHNRDQAAGAKQRQCWEHAGCSADGRPPGIPVPNSQWPMWAII